MRVPPIEELTEIGRLSLRAIELGYACAETDGRRLAAFLYFCNRIPVSRRWMERIPDEPALLRFLRISSDGRWPGSSRIRLDSIGSTMAGNGVDPHWRFWKIDRGVSTTRGEGGGFKLYISPYCEDLPSLVRRLGKYLEGSGAHAVKIGRSVQALLRPDKLMVYFSDLGDAVGLGRRLLSEICLNRAHGVPFSYPVGRSSLVSIGFDPPETVKWPYGMEGQSWRLWVTSCVARAILRVRKTRWSEPIEQVLEEVQAQRIDPFLWRPLGGAWGAWTAK